MAKPTGGGGMTQVAFRFDNPSRHSNQQVETGLLAALERHRLNATFAVIPYSLMDIDIVALTADVLPHIMTAANAELIEIAQHGYCRQRRGVTDKGSTSKFFGVLSDERQWMIKAGRAQLSRVFGRMPFGFAPPWNSYDENSIACLEDLGFTHLSANWDGALSTRLTMLLRSSNTFDLQGNVNTMWPSRLNDAVIVVFRHFFFVEDAVREARWQLSDFDAQLACLKGQNDINVVNFARLAGNFPTFKWRRTYRTQNIRSKCPCREQHRLPPGCLLTIPAWRAVLAAL